MNQFINMLDQEMVSFPNSAIVVCIEEGKRKLTNAVFLLGAFMILRLEMRTSDVEESFSGICPILIEQYHSGGDAQQICDKFQLYLTDCWRGLEKGKSIGWVRCAPGYKWGEIDVEQYAHYDNPNNGNLHMVVPGKFVAF